YHLRVPSLPPAAGGRCKETSAPTNTRRCSRAPALHPVSRLVATSDNRASVRVARYRNTHRPNHTAAPPPCTALPRQRTRATLKSGGNTTCNCSSTAECCSPHPSTTTHHPSLDGV